MRNTKVLFRGGLIGFSIAIFFIALVAYKSAPKDTPGGADAVANRDVYYPGSETLAPDEMRVVAPVSYTHLTLPTTPYV